MAGLKIRNLTKIYKLDGQDFYALSNINLDVDDKSFITVVGKSGSGKTTLLRIICGLEQCTKGEINIKSCKSGDEKVAIVFQEPRLMPWLTVEQNMALSCRNLSDDKTKKIVSKYLDMLGLTKFKDAYPAQISGGMAQRTALGRTLCYDPDLILMDEPLGALDAFTRRKLQDELVKIFLSGRKTIIFVTHDVDEAVMLGEKVIVLEQGKIKSQIDVNLPYPRDPISQEFYMLREKILKTIME